MPKALIPLAQGCEELEAVTIIDLLRRAGVEVVTAGLDDQPVTASRGVVLIPDVALDQVIDDGFDLVVLPGGQPGANNLNDDARIHELVKRTLDQGNYAGAICAGPKVLATAGVLDGRQATSYPGLLDKMDLPHVDVDLRPVIRDGQVISSRGPGTAMDFALELIRVLMGDAKRDEVEAALAR